MFRIRSEMLLALSATGVSLTKDGAQFANDELLESLSEVGMTIRIEERVYGAVEPEKPECHFEHRRADQSWPQSPNQVANCVRRPGERKGAYNHSQGSRRALVSLQISRFPLLQNGGRRALHFVHVHRILLHLLGSGLDVEIDFEIYVRYRHERRQEFDDSH